MSEQDLTVTPSQVRSVTLFEDRAEVVRHARVSLARGAQWIRLAGVSPYADDRTVQARVVAEGATVLAARVVRQFHHEPTLDRAQLEALETEARLAYAEAERAALAQERAEQAAARVGQMQAQWAQQVGQAPRRIGNPAGVSSWRDAWNALESAQERHAREAEQADHALILAREQAERAEQRLAAGRLEQSRWQAIIEVQVVATTAGEAEVESTYRVPCALWRPEHLASLAAADAGALGAGTVKWVTFATAWQQTGEVWEDVPMSFSTARPARIATPPPITDDLLATRRKTEQEKREIVVEQQEHKVALAGLDRGTREVDEMPGVDDGGLPRVYVAPGKVTLPSDGRPFRVEVASWSAPAELARVLIPEQSQVSHVRATMTNPGPEPVLAGPIRLARGGSLVGRSRVDFVGAGEPFELGFGPDDGVRVRREVSTDRDTAMLTGAQKIRRTVTLHVSNLSGEARAVLICERLPVSEIEAVQITPLDLREWKHDAQDGFLKLAVELPPRGTRTVKFAYEIKAGAKVRLPASVCPPS